MIKVINFYTNNLYKRYKGGIMKSYNELEEENKIFKKKNQKLVLVIALSFIFPTIEDVIEKVVEKLPNQLLLEIEHPENLFQKNRRINDI